MAPIRQGRRAPLKLDLCREANGSWPMTAPWHPRRRRYPGVRGRGQPVSPPRPRVRCKNHAVANGIDCDFFSPDAAVPTPFSAGPVFVFTGTMDYRPNIDAVVWFAITSSRF